MPAPIIEKYLAAFNVGEVRALADLYAPQTQFVNPFSPVSLRSREEVHEFVGRMFAAYSDLTAELTDVILAGRREVARLAISAKRVRSLAHEGDVIEPSGRTLTMHTAEFFRTDGAGLIIEHVRLFDTAALLAQLT